VNIPENPALRQAQLYVARLQERTEPALQRAREADEAKQHAARLRGEEQERAMRQLVTSLGPAQLQQLVPLLLPILSPAQNVRLLKACVARECALVASGKPSNAPPVLLAAISLGLALAETYVTPDSEPRARSSA
jgi:hypothetical protein